MKWSYCLNHCRNLLGYVSNRTLKYRNDAGDCQTRRSCCQSVLCVATIAGNFRCLYFSDFFAPYVLRTSTIVLFCRRHLMSPSMILLESWYVSNAFVVCLKWKANTLSNDVCLICLVMSEGEVLAEIWKRN